MKSRIGKYCSSIGSRSRPAAESPGRVRSGPRKPSRLFTRTPALASPARDCFRAELPWCRRGDSNSHGLRHCPLKTACLPISPRRLVRTPASSRPPHAVADRSLPLPHRSPYFGTSLAFEPRPAPPRAALRGSDRGWRGRRRACRRADVLGRGSVDAARDPSGLAAALPECGREPGEPEARSAKNTAASTAVVRDRKLAEPAAPNTLPDEPLPNAAPMSAPLPCCRSTKPQMPVGDQQV